MLQYSAIEAFVRPEDVSIDEYCDIVTETMPVGIPAKCNMDNEMYQDNRDGKQEYPTPSLTDSRKSQDKTLSCFTLQIEEKRERHYREDEEQTDEPKVSAIVTQEAKIPVNIVKVIKFENT